MREERAKTDASPRADLQARLEERLASYMERKGLRSTEQRRLIVESFFAAAEHISIDELLARVRELDPRVGYATVYRTLKLLAEAGVANERRFGDGFTRYELADEDHHHDHIICLDCGQIVEFEDPNIELRQHELAASRGFRLEQHKHELYCRCVTPDCPNLAGKPR